jgi:Xaa-Pro aminopeptidase
MMKSTDIIKASANSLNIYSFTAEALERLIEAVKAEQSCKTCEALARTVMLDQTSHDAQRKPLTDEEIWKFWWSRPEVPDGEDDSMEAEFVAAVRRVLAAHGIGGES